MQDKEVKSHLACMLEKKKPGLETWLTTLKLHVSLSLKEINIQGLHKELVHFNAQDHHGNTQLRPTSGLYCASFLHAGLTEVRWWIISWWIKEQAFLQTGSQNNYLSWGSTLWYTWSNMILSIWQQNLTSKDIFVVVINHHLLTNLTHNIRHTVIYINLTVKLKVKKKE